MLMPHVVCFCFEKETCKETTESIAKANGVTKWFVEPVCAPLSNEITYRGTIVREVV